MAGVTTRVPLLPLGTHRHTCTCNKHSHVQPTVDHRIYDVWTTAFYAGLRQTVFGANWSLCYILSHLLERFPDGLPVTSGWNLANLDSAPDTHDQLWKVVNTQKYTFCQKGVAFCEETIVRRNKKACQPLVAQRRLEDAVRPYSFLRIFVIVNNQIQWQKCSRKYNQSATQAAGVMVGQQKNRTAAVCRSVLYGITVMWNKWSAIVGAPDEQQLPQC